MCRGRVDAVPHAIRGNALQALAKVRVKRVCVGHEATEGVCVDLVGEGPRMQRQSSLMVAAPSREEEVGVSIH